MYLKSIKAHGFKSFADKIEINLGKNINGIVGPNGSGKSNVVDAVRWVLGEGSIKSLRGESSTDVIFSGSKSRKALNSASVTLTFDNSDLYLPIQYTEVSVKRVMYRSGENEYYLNNEKCRLKDITNLLTDTGADKESFNMIGQGKIDEILSTKPSDRRIIFESAAGVLKYKRRKEEATRKLERTNYNIDRVNDIINELENNLSTLERQSKNATNFLNLKENLNDLEISLMVKDIQDLNYQTKTLKEKIDKINDEIINLSKNHSTYDIDLLTKKDELKKIEEKINHHQSTLIEIIKSIEKIDADIRVLKTRKELETTPDENKYITLKEEILKQETTIQNINGKIEEQNQKYKLTNNHYQEETEKYEKIKATKNKINQNLENINREKSNLKYKIDILSSNIENNNSIPNSIRSILSNKRFTGIHDILGKLIEIDKPYETAITISLGSAINYLVVNKSNDAKIMINYLKENNLGRATFFPIDSIRERYIDEVTLCKLKNVEGYLTIASEVIKRDNIFDNIIKNQLGNVIIADNLTNANNISKLINNRYKIVTLDGQIVNVGGTITGGSLPTTHNYLKDKYELSEKENQLKTLDEEEKELIQKLKDKNKELEIEENNIYQIKQEIISINENKNIYISSLTKEKNQLLTLEQELKDIESISHNESDSRLEAMMTMYYSALTNKDNIEKDQKLLQNQKDNIEKSILEIEEISKRENHYLNSREKELKELEIKLNTSNIKLDHLLISLGENYNLTYEKAKDTYHLEIESELARQKIKELKSDIQELGYVNIDAIEEYKKVKSRYDFLENQKNDLKEAENTLLKIIQEMDEIMKERFQTTFEAIRIEFKKVFKEMFGGGEAELILTEPDNLLETGIEIKAIPSGKTLKSISLLSGGEKTFTAISLLFAILNIRPVPFCLFDEVEAALDDANVESFGNYLYKYKDKTQFILITHKKKTMEFADILYGITMQESGVSKLVSVRLEDVKEAK